MVYIKVGNLIERTIIKKLLSAVPPRDLEGLISICIRTVVHKFQKKKYPRWGGALGQFNGRANKETGRIWLYLWGIQSKTFKDFHYANSNLYINFIKNLASTLYHEIGHLKHSKTKEYKKQKEKLGKLTDKRRLLLRKIDPTIKFNPYENIIYIYRKTPTPLDIEYKKAVSQIDKIGELIEGYANNYSKTIMEKAEKLNLFERPAPNEIRFFSIIRQKHLDYWFKQRELMRTDKKSGGWGHMLAVFDHIRKCKIDAKYNLRELFNEIYDNAYPYKNRLRRFKRFILKHVTPIWYISKTGRKYAYFNDKHLEKTAKLEGLIGFITNATTVDYEAEEETSIVTNPEFLIICPECGEANLAFFQVCEACGGSLQHEGRARMEEA